MASLNEVQRLVVKIGSALLVDAATGEFRQNWLSGLALDVADLRTKDVDVVLVSSGSIALGRSILGLGNGALTLEQSQAAAAVGQIRLAQAYQEVLAPFSLTAAQILLTLDDSEDRRRYLNSRATLSQLLRLGVIPIVNENDTIATDEIRFGDNDRLAAQIAATVGADCLVLLSDVDGFYSGDPRQDPTAKRYDIITKITPEIEAMAGDEGSGLSKGGMKTKLLAARTVISAGCNMAITEGSLQRPLSQLAQGAPATWFLAEDDPHVARKRWIAAMKPRGVVRVDPGAEDALRNGRSLLPAGVNGVQGMFGRGEPVQISSGDHVLGQGLSRYTSDEVAKIKGQQTRDIEMILGYPGRAALIHRDDLAM